MRGERELHSYLLFKSSNDSNSQQWERPKPGAKNSVQHLNCLDHLLLPSMVVRMEEAGTETEPGLKPRRSNIGANITIVLSVCS